MNKKETKSFFYRYGSLVPIIIIALNNYTLLFVIFNEVGLILLRASGHSGFGYLLYLAVVVSPLIALTPLVLETACLQVAILAHIFGLLPDTSSAPKVKMKISEIERRARARRQ